MPLTESRSEPKTRANMPLLRQLEFAFRSTNLLFVGPPGVSPGELINESAGKMPAGHPAGTGGNPAGTGGRRRGGYRRPFGSRPDGSGAGPAGGHGPQPDVTWIT